jgi:hypothetical protein
MRIKVETIVMLVLCVITCFAAWQVYQIAESLRPIVDTIKAVNHFVPWK